VKHFNDALGLMRNINSKSKLGMHFCFETTTPNKDKIIIAEALFKLAVFLSSNLLAAAIDNPDARRRAMSDVSSILTGGDRAKIILEGAKLNAKPSVSPTATINMTSKVAISSQEGSESNVSIISSSSFTSSAVDDSALYDLFYDFVFDECDDGRHYDRNSNEFYEKYPQYAERFISLGKEICSVKASNERGMVVWIDEAEESYYEAIPINFDDESRYRDSRLYDVFTDYVRNRSPGRILTATSMAAFYIKFPQHMARMRKLRMNIVSIKESCPTGKLIWVGEDASPRSPRSPGSDGLESGQGYYTVVDVEPLIGSMSQSSSKITAASTATTRSNKSDSSSGSTNTAIRKPDPLEASTTHAVTFITSYDDRGEYEPKPPGNNIGKLLADRSVTRHWKVYFLSLFKNAKLTKRKDGTFTQPKFVRMLRDHYLGSYGKDIELQYREPFGWKECDKFISEYCKPAESTASAATLSNDGDNDSLLYDHLFAFVRERTDLRLAARAVKEFYGTHPEHKKRFSELREKICEVKQSCPGGMLVWLGEFRCYEAIPIDMPVSKVAAPNPGSKLGGAVAATADNDTTTDFHIYDALYKFVSKEKERSFRWREMNRFYKEYPQYEARLMRLKDKICNAVEGKDTGGRLLIWIDATVENEEGGFEAI
jgi:hypothetical protein